MWVLQAICTSASLTCACSMLNIVESDVTDESTSPCHLQNVSFSTDFKYIYLLISLFKIMKRSQCLLWSRRSDYFSITRFLCAIYSLLYLSVVNLYASYPYNVTIYSWLPTISRIRTLVWTMLPFFHYLYQFKLCMHYFRLSVANILAPF